MCLIAAHGLKITAGLLTGQGMRAAARTGGTIAAGIIDGLLFRLGKNPKYLPGPAGTLPEPVPVLFFSNYASLTRGGLKSIWYILRDIDRMRYRPVLACQEEGQLTELARAAGIPVEIVPLPRLRLCALPAIFACLRQFRGMLDRHRIRVVHSEELVVIALMSVLKPFHRVRLIWHVRVNWDYPLQKRIGLLLADRIICVSRAVARRFPASRRVSVAQNGVDAAECVPGPSAIVSERFNGGDTVIGCFATVAAHKGQHVLIRAAARLAGTYPGLKFLLAGDGEPRYLEELRALAGELHVTQNIIFWGAEKDDVRGLLRRVDIFVLPSFVEGLSRSLLEAMAFARPVIASDIPENAEAVTTGENGLLFKAGDADDLAAKIAELMADRPRAQRLGENARARVLRDFSLESTMRNIYAVYESFGALCGRRNG
jgi:glycosyltransferase involved in cell wall biosynthesis